MRRVTVLGAGVAVWFVGGAAVAALLTLGVGSWSNGFAISGIVFVVGAVAWVIGPSKTPMTWSEGALLTYQGNAERRPRGRTNRRRKLALPVCALMAGVLLIGVAAALAVAG